MGPVTPVNAQAADRAGGRRAAPAAREAVPLRRLWLWGGAGGLLVWLAFPPVSWSLLGWVALVPWARLVAQPERWSARHYRHAYAIGVLHWLVLLQWVRLPHWSAYFGWLALAVYLGVYLPAFFLAARWQVHRWGLSSLVAVPLVWTALELARGYLFTGFSLALLGHTQIGWPLVIQVADLGGAYLVSLVLALTAACAERLLAGDLRAGKPVRRWALPAGVLLASLGLVGAYGTIRMAEPPAAAPPARVALIQGSIDTTFDPDSGLPRRVMRQYRQLTAAALAADAGLDVIIWPESMFTPDVPMVGLQEPLEPTPSWEAGEDAFVERMRALRTYTLEKAQLAGRMFGVPMVVGGEWWDAGPWGVRRYNSALWIDARGTIRGRYDKMHPVMFGEYVPLGDIVPWLYRLTPMSGGLTAGQRAELFTCGPLRMAPSICFENLVPQLIRRQIRDLRARGERPNCLVTVTNDGWFWGSSALDLHLAGAAFRAVEHRMPLLIAANTGFSAAVDARGRILAKGPRREPAPVLAQVRPRSGRTAYQAAGDGPIGGLLLVTVASWIHAMYHAWHVRRSARRGA